MNKSSTSIYSSSTVLSSTAKNHERVLELAKKSKNDNHNEKITTLNQFDKPISNIYHGSMHDVMRLIVSHCVTNVYQSASDYAGGFVVLKDEFQGLPVLERKGKTPVRLYEFIEAVDGLVDYDEIIEEFPGLTYSQISSALGFVRRLTQFNRLGVDIDKLEDEELESDPEFQIRVLQGVQSQEERRVLNPQ